jgi:hypothetical protein
VAEDAQDIGLGLQRVSGEESDVHGVLGSARGGRERTGRRVAERTQAPDFRGSYVDTAGGETVAWFGMATVSSSRKRKAAPVVAHKRSGADSAKGKAPVGAAAKVVRPVAPGVSGKSREGGVGVSLKEEAGKAPAVGAGQPDRSPPALPIPIASFTF